MDTETAFAILALAAGIFLAWLAVRLLIRDRRPLKLAWAVVALIIAYPALLGPSCWLSSRTGRGREVVSGVYSPFLRLCHAYELQRFCEVLLWYSGCGAADCWHWYFIVYITEPRPGAGDAANQPTFRLMIKWDREVELARPSHVPDAPKAVRGR